jgi:uncharacterized protein
MTPMSLILLAVVSFISWCVSLLVGGGSPLLLIPLISFLFGLEAVAPVLTLGLLIGHVQRIFLFRDEIDWPCTQWFMPGAIAGAILGAYLLTLIYLDGLQFVLGLLLVLMALYFWVGPKAIALTIKTWHFLPMSFVNAIGSSLVGSTGPITNPMYLSYGLTKEGFLATKSLHTSVLHLVKIVAYVGLGLYQPEYFLYGVVIGVASFPGNWVGRIFLERMSPDGFTKAVFLFMAVSGCWMLWDQRVWFLALVNVGTA